MPRPTAIDLARRVKRPNTQKDADNVIQVNANPDKPVKADKAKCFDSSVTSSMMKFSHWKVVML